VKAVQNLVNSISSSENLSITVFYLDKKTDENVKMAVPVVWLDRHKFCFNDYDIIHTNGIRPDLFAYLNRKKIRIHISTIHNFVFEDLKFSYNRFVSVFFGTIWLLLWKRADRLVCVSKIMREYYAKWYSLPTLEVIYNGITEIDKSFAPDKNVIVAMQNFHSRGLKVLGSAAILTKRKGIEQALHLIAGDGRLALVIIGDGKERPDLLRLTKKLKITDRCLFTGFKENAVSYFSYFDFFIMPSRSEGFGLALIEAAQQMIPIICSNLKVFNELFNTEEVTFFELDNLTSLSDALQISLENGKEKADLAYKRYLNHYTASRMAMQYYDLYKSA
jgi:glycosyltransferase involved in cell wall biosynthesis